jgi:urease accessory protein
MARYLKTMPATAAILFALVSIEPALAHHVMGRELPSTFWQGLLSGLGHPIIGIDHFAFVVGVGLTAYLARRIALLPLLFVAGTVLGCFIHLRDFDLPGSEAAIAFSLFVLAAIVGLRTKVPVALIAILFAAAGILHGYAYGESIIGAETAPLGAYVVGFALIQYCIAVVSGAAVAVLVARDYLSETIAMRTAGAAIALVAVAYFANVTLG